MQTLKTLAALPSHQINVRRLVFHENAHTDEFAVLAFRRIPAFRKQIEDRFPGFSRAKVELWSLGQTFDLAASDSDNVVAIGTGRQLLDEHGKSEAKKTCASEIFGREVGILLDDEEILKKDSDERASYEAVRLMIEVIKDEDLNSASSGASIHAMLKKINRLKNPISLQSIINWCVWAYVAEYHALKKEIEKSNGRVVSPKVLDIERGKKNIAAYFGERRANQWVTLAKKTKEESDAVINQTIDMLIADKQKAQPKFWSTFDVRKDGKWFEYSMLAIELSDFNYYIPTAIRRMKKRDQPDVMLIRQPNAQTAVMSEKDNIDFTYVARALRIQELKMMCDNKSRFTVRELSVQGNVNNWPKNEAYWYLHEKEFLNQLYCGAESAPNAHGTQIPFEKMCKLVKTVMGNSFHRDFYRSCDRGICAGDKCPFFRLYMPMCTQVRGTPASQAVVQLENSCINMMA